MPTLSRRVGAFATFCRRHKICSRLFRPGGSSASNILGVLMVFFGVAVPAKLRGGRVPPLRRPISRMEHSFWFPKRRRALSIVSQVLALAG